MSAAAEASPRVITAAFTDGAGTTVPDQYPGMAGAGWTGSWTSGNLPAAGISAALETTPPLAGGGNHLKVALASTAADAGIGRSFSTADAFHGIDPSQPVAFRFSLRLDAANTGFTASGDNLTIHNNPGLVSSSGSSTWILRLVGGATPQWQAYNGTRDGGGFNPARLVNTGMNAVPGTTYTFTVTSDPAARSYSVEVTDGSATATLSDLGFRTAATTAGNTLGVFARKDAAGDALAFALDSVEISGTTPGLPAATAADRVDGNLILLNDNGGWSWYQDERSLRDPANGHIVVTSAANHLGYGGEPRDGDIDTVSFDPATGRRDRFILGNLPFSNPSSGDDHNIGALWRRADGRYLASWCNHNDTTRNTRFRITSAPGDATDWDPVFSFNWSAAPGSASRNVTYSNLLFLSAEGTGQGRLYNIAREQNRDPHLSYSDDQGQTWTYGGRLSTQASSFGYSNGYFKFKSNGIDRIDFICTEAHPRDHDNSIYHGYLRAGKSHDSHGNVIDANVFDNTAPAPQAFTRVWATEGTGPATRHHGWTSEIELDAQGRPVVLFTTRHGNVVVDGHAGAGDHRIFYGRFDGGDWRTTELGKMGELFHSGEQDYTGIGCIHPEDSGTLYLATPVHPGTGLAFASGKREIFQGKSADAGATWSWKQLTFDSTVDNARPIIPSWDKDHTALLWWRGDYPWQRDYDLSVVGMILDPGLRGGAVAYHDATAANTTLADGSPLVTGGEDTTTGSNGDGHWHATTGFGGNGGGFLAANFAASELAAAENAPALKTRIDGLADGTYDVFAYFVSPPGAADWRIAAGFPGETPMNFRRASSQQAEPSQFAGTVETLWPAKGTALYRGYVGRRVVSGGVIEVLVDDEPSAAAYDGIGVSRVLPVLEVGKGETRVLVNDGTLYADILNRGTLILKGDAAPQVDGAFINEGFLDLLVFSGEVPATTGSGTVLAPREGLRISQVEASASEIRIAIGTHAGHGYQLQGSASMAAQSWADFGPQRAGTGTDGMPQLLEWIIPRPGDDRWFFRVIVD